MKEASKNGAARGGCISLIGMAGAGKTTIGESLARKLGWAFMDTDYLIESLYAARLQDVTDSVSREAFLNLEAEMISLLSASHCVIATGGSVIYRHRAMQKLAELGSVVYIRADIPVILERIALKPERGIVLEPGQDLADLFREREPLYEKYANYVCNSGQGTVEECVAALIGQLGMQEGTPLSVQRQAPLHD